MLRIGMFQTLFSVIAVVLQSDPFVEQLKNSGRLDLGNYSVVGWGIHGGNTNVTPTFAEAEIQAIGFKTKRYCFNEPCKEAYEELFNCVCLPQYVCSSYSPVDVAFCQISQLNYVWEQNA